MIALSYLWQGSICPLTGQDMKDEATEPEASKYHEIGANHHTSIRSSQLEDSGNKQPLQDIPFLHMNEIPRSGSDAS